MAFVAMFSRLLPPVTGCRPGTGRRELVRCTPQLGLTACISTICGISIEVQRCLL